MRFDHMRVYIGIDNGVSGSIGVVGDDFKPALFHTPTKSEQSYTKTKQLITRVDRSKLFEILNNYGCDLYSSFIVLERPMVNPGRFKASMSAIRCLEVTLTVVEQLKIPYQYCDSKEWQKVLIPAGIDKGLLKKVSLEIGKRLFPNIDFKGFTDADGLLMAEWARRTRL